MAGANEHSRRAVTWWSHEDGGPRRTQTVSGSLGLRGAPAVKGRLAVTTSIAPAATMVVGDTRRGHLYLLRHGAGEGATGCIERIDPVTLEALGRSPDLPGGPVWPGGAGVADDGSVHVVFGNHAHRLTPELAVAATRRLPRDRPYNSFVPLPDGCLATKDFGGSRPGLTVAPAQRQPCELLALRPDDLEVLDALVLPEPSVARLSADDDTVYVVGDTSLLRVRWDGGRLALDDDFAVPYRTLEGQTYGWDAVLAAGAAWFLDDGDGSERFAGTLRGIGVSTAPLHLVRVDLASGDVAMAEVCGRPGGLVANPPVVDEGRGLVLAYDSGNGVVACFESGTLAARWRRDQDHGGHLLLYAESGEVVTGDGVDVVVLDIETGEELARADSGHGMQSVLFPCPGEGRSFYVCSFVGVSRFEVV